ncbi:MAG: hypothetical protein ACO3YY_03200 [Phycisphaerales bacterium]
MRILLVAALLAAPTLLVDAASGQSLSDRIAGVAAQRQQARAAGQARLLGALVQGRVTADFNETPARDAFEFLQASLGVPIVVRYDTDRNATSGIDPDAPITIEADRMLALDLLKLMLAQCESFEPSTWQLREGYIEVGTKERLSVPAARELRMYPVRDLLFDPPMFDNAPDFNLADSIQQGGGYGGGGGGGGFGGGGGGGGFGGGGGGGGFGGGGGGSGGGGGGGGVPFGEAGEAPERRSEEEKVQDLVDLIIESVEPESWVDNGGDAATIRYYQGVLIVRAPDFIQRQIGGYPFAPRAPRAVRPAGGRYVGLDASLGINQDVRFRDQTVTGSAGN